jgi:hypothetical protein
MSDKAPRSRRALAGLLFTATLTAIMLLPSLSVTAAPAKIYTLNITPTSATAGQSADFFATLKNVTPGVATVNSFSTTVPFAVSGSISASIVPPPAPPGSTNLNASKSVQVDQSSRVVTVRSIDPLKNNQVIVLKITATPALGSCSSTPYAWAPGGTRVNTGNSLNGDAFSLTNTTANPSSVNTTVSCGPGPPASVTFTTEPTNTLVNDCINNLDCPATPTGAVEVEVEDVNGNHVADGTNVTMSIGVDPSGPPSPLGGTLTQSTTGGFASFSDLTIDTTSSGYVLHAQSGAASGDSATFAITNTNTACGGEGQPACTATFPNGTSTVTAPAGTELIIETNQLECDGVETPIAGTVTINPSGTGVIQVEFTDQSTFPILAPFPFCKSPPEPPATLPLCNTIDNGFDQNLDGVPCIEQTFVPGVFPAVTINSTLWMDSSDPHAKH